ncbi:TetR/AcrR family transcriptional regulator [Aeromicrobium terrae]|nr:helix-turn-helix domain-containing protein [Aeromicrobium terrae]
MVRFALTGRPPLGLRERKKIKLRRSVRAEALRLFAAQGYDETTVEQIADAADISTTTFYRYFPTKEDTVLDDEYDSLVEQCLGSETSASLFAMVMAAVTAVAAAVEAERETALARLRLFATVPALKARQGAEGSGTRDLYARLLSEHSGRPVDDFALRITAAALTAAMLEATNRWSDGSGRESLVTLMNEAVTVLEPLIVAL